MAKIELNKIYTPLIINDTRYFIVTGGRGSGKSFAITTLLCLLMLERDRVILFLRQTLTSAHISIIPEFTEKLDLLGISDQFHITKTEIEHKETGSRILFRGIQTGSKNNTANLKSINGVSIMVVDEAEELVSEETFDKIDLSVRQKGVQNKVMLVMNPARKDHWIYKRFFKESKVSGGYSGQTNDCTYIHTTFEDNIDNLDEGFLAQLARLKSTNLKKYNHLVLGEWSDGDNDFSLWTQILIDGLRVQETPPLKRIVVAIDPAVTSKDTSDETGIIVGGVGFDNHFYVLEDATGTYAPIDWCTKAIVLFRKWKADRIVGEVNNGGDLIETILRTIDVNIPYKSVHATRDKLTRAEPVAALYEQGKAHHVGRFVELEYEQTTWEGKNGDKSPNRIDAAVWCATELVLNQPVEEDIEIEFI
ncbi:MAG: hypothetical protein [Caudoviricetes sp.]|nr:MAG: hypothetical protein [Caudoviricetes sp.]